MQKTIITCDHCEAVCDGKLSITTSYALGILMGSQADIHACSREHLCFALAKAFGIPIDGNLAARVDELQRMLTGAQYDADSTREELSRAQVHIASLEAKARTYKAERDYNEEALRIAREKASPGRFDEGLVERLAKHLDPHDPHSSTGIARDAVEFVIAELASMPVEMPTADEYAESLHNSGLISRWIGDWTRPIETLVRSRLGPILAAKDARIAEQERQLDIASRLLATERKASAERIAELESTLYHTETQRNDALAKLTTLEKRLALTPVDDGKTPGDVAREAVVIRFGEGTVIVTRSGKPGDVWDSAALAVLRAFGGVDVLRRVRERVADMPVLMAKWEVVRDDAVAIIDDELATLGASITDPSKPTKPLVRCQQCMGAGVIKQEDDRVREGWHAGPCNRCNGKGMVEQ